MEMAVNTAVQDQVPHTQVTWQGRPVTVIGSYDLVVVGAGSAGSACAIKAAQLGLNVLVADRFSCMGGSAVNALVCPMMPTYVDHLSVFHQVEEALLSKGKMTRDNYTTMLWFEPDALAQTFEELLLAAGGTTLYDATFVDVIVAPTTNNNSQIDQGKTLTHVIFATVEGLVAVAASQFVDASGDAVLARAAGVPCANGDDEHVDQVCSLRFTMGGVDTEAYRKYVLSLGDTFSPLVEGYFFESAMVAGRNFKLEPIFRAGIERGLLEEEDLRYYQTFSIPNKPGCIALNCPHIASLKNNTSALARSAAIREGHERIGRLVHFLHEMMPGFENSYLMQVAPLLGVRESWRICGKYLLTEEDYTNQARFDDGVVRGDWYIDVHSNKKGLFHQNTYQHGDYYEIPWRSYVTNEVENLAVAGRCISTTFLMQASVRIIPTCIDMGEVVARGCKQARDKDISLSRLDFKK